METNCLLDDLFLYSYENKILKNKRMADTLAFNHTFNYVYDVLTINNLNFGNWIPLIYNEELEIKEITETAYFSSFLGIYLKFG